MSKSESSKKRWSGVGKKVIGAVTSAVLAVSLAPAAAFASASGGADDTGYYTLPSTYVTDLNHQGDGYSYRYLTSGISRVVGGFSQSMYYLMGINGINFDRGLRNGQPWNNVTNGTLKANHVTAVDGIMGTEVNSVPDEYLWNSCVYMNQNPGTDLRTVSRETTFSNKMVWMYQGAGNPTAYETYNVEVDGVTYAMPSVIYMEANFISNSDPDWTSASGKSIAEWVEIEKARTGGDPNYDPYVTTWTTNSGGINFGTELMYKLADAVNAATNDSRDSNGNATLMSRYVDANGDRGTAGLYTSATEFVQKYEDFAKASQYYMIDQFANHGVEKKVSAVICGYDPGTGVNIDGTEVEGAYKGDAAYACRIYDPSITGFDNNTANFGGRPANSVMNISTDINTVLSADDVAFPAAEGQENYVRWYTAEQIAKVADAVFVTDVPYGNNIASYLAKNSAGDTQMIYSVDNSNYTKMNENVEPLVAACEATGAKADVYYKFPSHLFGVWYAQGFENCWFAPMAAAWMYPEQFTSIENVMAYAAKNFWHINAADVNGVLAATCSDLSMPTGSTFGEPDADYESVVDSMLLHGNSYYVDDAAGREAISKMNCGDLVTYDLSALTNRVTAQGTIETLQTQIAELQAEITELIASGAADQTAITNLKSQISVLQTQLSNAMGIVTTDTAALEEAQATIEQLQAQLDKASAVANVNKATVKAADIPEAATTVILGEKVKKISANAFKNSNAKKIIVSSTKLTKAKVKNCLKGSKVKTVQVPGSKYNAYKKIFVKNVVGKKVKVA